MNRAPRILLVSFSAIFLFSPIFSDEIDLFEAISWEQEEDLRVALRSGGNPNQINSDLGISILMKAIETMKPDLVKVLLDGKANVNLKVPGSQKTSIMHFMEKYIMSSEEDSNGNSDYKDDEAMITILNHLIKAGAKVKDQDIEGKSVLAYALDSAYAGQSEYILGKLIAGKADPKTNFSKDIPKPLCYIVAEDTTGSKKLAFKYFIKHKLCDLNKEYSEKNSAKTTLLYIAVSKKDKEAVKILLEAGANPNKGASDTMMDYLPLFPVISDIEILELLLQYKANPNSIENEIHLMEHAARNVADDESGEKIIDLLLKYGTDINHPKLFDSYSPYNKAVYAAHIVGKSRIEQYLKKKGAAQADELKIKKKFESNK
jgi:ankyrin repeat protein